MTKIYIFDKFTGTKTRTTIKDLKEDWRERKNQFSQKNFKDWCYYIGVVRV